MIVLIIAYFTEGVGFVVQATFLPDIINNLKGLEGYGSLTWTLVGVAGIPSCIIWMLLAHRFGSSNIIIIALLLQAVGILIPAFSSNIYLNLLSGVLWRHFYRTCSTFYESWRSAITWKPCCFNGSNDIFIWNRAGDSTTL